MSDLINKQAAVSIPALPKEYREYQTMNLDDAYELGWYDLQKCIEKMPSAQPEHKKGKWLRSGSCIFPYECDQCGDTNERATPFCPNCGADMRGDSDEKCMDV